MTEQELSRQKSVLRERYRKIRDALPREQINADSQEIWKLFFKSPQYQRAERIAFYLNFRSEVETLPYLERVMNEGKRVAVPLCSVEENRMQMYEIPNRSVLTQGKYGILEPNLAQNRKENVSPVTEWKQNDIVLVPALAFDRLGYRLGYGAGYYDRFLCDKDVTSVGLAFSCCVCECLPHEQTDQRVSFLITETGCEI